MKNESTSERYMRNRSFMSSDASEKSMTRWPAYSFSANARASVLFPVRRAPSSRSARLPREPSFQDRSFSYALRLNMPPPRPSGCARTKRELCIGWILHETGGVEATFHTRNGKCGNGSQYTRREVRPGRRRRRDPRALHRENGARLTALRRQADPSPLDPPPPELAIICSSRKENDV